MNTFYQKSKFFQWSIALLLLAIVIVIMGYWIKLTQISLWYFLLIFFNAPIVQFGITPFLTLIGNYKYVSPMLLVYNPSPIKYDLHNGTSFDYLMVLRTYKMGAPVKSKILEYYLEGFLKIMEEIEAGKLPMDVEITGSSYFFSERTAKRLGFVISDASAAEKTNIVANYMDLTWMYSVANGKLSFPNLKNIKNAKISGGKLVQAKANFDRLHEYLKNKNPHC